MARFENATGVIDGVNRDFTVLYPYEPGSVAVFLNGILQTRTFADGWVETDPASGLVTLNEAPRALGLPGVSPDVVQIFYRDSSSATLPSGQIVRLTGRLLLARESGLSGSILSPTFRAVVGGGVSLRGVVTGQQGLTALVSMPSGLRGVIADCG